MAAIYTATRSGAGFDLLSPNPAAIDFDEIAMTLAFINRFNGAFEKPVSVAQHTLIAVECAPFSLKPWVALHDAHEYVLGDWTRPAVAAVSHIANGIAAESGAAFRIALDQLRQSHDAAIHEAAGLPMPTPQQAVDILKFDNIALATERRDFLARPRFRWGAIDHVQPAPRRYGFLPPDVVGTKLAQLFRTLLPSLSDRSPR